jgi:chromatin modification-related protein EAF6
MAEASTVPTADDRSRYETLKKEIMQALPKKRAIDKSLVCSWKSLSTSPECVNPDSLIQAITEVQIYNLEAAYLTETAAHSGGNIIQGFENYLKNQSSGRRRYEVHDQDRVFSNSSLTYQKVRIPSMDIYICYS